MKKLKRIPTSEDMENAKDLPSPSIYAERFGSWKKVKQKLGKKELNKKSCEYCGKTISFKKKSKRFCSSACSQKFLLKEKHKNIPPKKCVVCGEEYRITEVSNFKKRKTCQKKECKKKLDLSVHAKKHNRLTPKIRKELLRLKDDKCSFCGFTKILYFMTRGRHSDKKLVNMVKKKDFDYFVVCPNHKEMVEKRLMKL